ncbi:MAG: TonB-dependent receptor [Pseudomonadota bacterium]
MDTRTRITRCGALFGAITALAAPAWAQEPTSEEVIIVTSLRTETEQDRQPARVDIIEREEIELSGAASLADALRALPGLSLVQSGPTGSQTSVFLRGTNSKHALALFDGLRLNDPSSASGGFDFGADLIGDVERVELVRGPLSSLYGSDAIGGVINILPRRGSGPARAYGELALGDFETTRLLLGLSGGNERGDLNLSLESLRTDGFNVTPERMAFAGSEDDGAEFITLSANGARALGGGWSVDVLARLRASEVEFDTFSGGASGFQRADDPDLRTKSGQSVLALGVTREAGALRSRLRVTQVDSELEAFNAGGLTDNYEGERRIVQLLNSWRPAAPGVLADPVISFGAEFQNEDILTDTAFNAPLSVDEHASAVFAAGQARLSDQLDLSGSLRLDAYDAFGSSLTGHIGAVYRLPVLDARLTASYGTAFKAPSLSERFASSASTLPNPDLEPEQSRTFELGLDARLPVAGGEGVQAGVRVFRTEIDDLIENVFDFTSSTGTNRNIGEAEIDGVELFASWTVTAQLTLSADYAYIDAVNALTGDRLLRRPEHSWAARAEWRPTDRTALRLAWRSIGERRDVLYDDAGFFDTADGVLGSHDIVDLGGSIDATERLQLFASLSNLFDQTYEQPAAFAGAPRALMVGLRLR